MLDFLKKKPVEPPREKIPLVKIYTDTTGVNWYRYENEVSLPGPRAIQAEIATRMAEMNLTKKELKSLIGYMKTEGNKGNFVDVFAVINELEFRLDFISEENTLLDLALVYFSIDGENETIVDRAANERKKQIFETDPAARDFFLVRSFRYTTAFSNISEEDIHVSLLNQMNENKATGQKLGHLLQLLNSTNTLMK